MPENIYYFLVIFSISLFTIGVLLLIIRKLEEELELLGEMLEITEKVYESLEEIREILKNIVELRKKFLKVAKNIKTYEDILPFSDKVINKFFSLEKEIEETNYKKKKEYLFRTKQQIDKLNALKEEVKEVEKLLESNLTAELS